MNTTPLYFFNYTYVYIQRENRKDILFHQKDLAPKAPPFPPNFGDLEDYWVAQMVVGYSRFK